MARLSCGSRAKVNGDRSKVCNAHCMPRAGRFAADQDTYNRVWPACCQHDPTLPCTRRGLVVTQLKDATAAAAVTGMEVPGAAQSVLLDDRSPAAAVAVSLAIRHLMVSWTVARLANL